MVKRAFACARYAVVGFALLTLASMLLYPGGTYRDRNSLGYQFFGNFLSDLGMPQSWGGQNNPWGALVFVSAELLLATSVIAFSVGLARLTSHGSSRFWARLAVVIGMTISIAVVAVAFTPANRFLSFHVEAVVIAVRGATVGGSVLAVAIARDRRFPRISVVAATLIAVVLGGYASVLEWGPPLSSDYGLRFQVTAQKVMFVVSLSSIVYLSVVGERIAMKDLIRSQSEVESLGTSIH